MAIYRTEDEIYEQIDLANQLKEDGDTIGFALSYEDGVKAALEWILGQSDAPMND